MALSVEDHICSRSVLAYTTTYNILASTVKSSTSVKHQHTAGSWLHPDSNVIIGIGHLAKVLAGFLLVKKHCSGLFFLESQNLLAQRILGWNLDGFSEELCRAQMYIWEVPDRQVSGCQDCLEDITAGSEMLLLISDSGTAPYQSFLFSSTLFSASSWLSQPRGGVSLISYLFSSLFPVVCMVSPGVGHGAAFGRAARVLPALPSRGCLVPCSRLPASLVYLNLFLPVSPSAPLLKLLSPPPVPCKFPHFIVHTIVLNSPALGFSPI